MLSLIAQTWIGLKEFLEWNDKLGKHWLDCSKSKSDLCEHYLQFQKKI